MVTIAQPSTIDPSFRASDAARRRRRLLECVPAALLLAPVLVIALLLTAPRAAYVVGAGYVAYWALRSVEMGIRQVLELRRIRRYQRIDWAGRLARLADPYRTLHGLAARPRLDTGQAEELAALSRWVHSGADVPGPENLYHLVVIPIVDEDGDVLKATLAALADADYPSTQLLVCLSFEERSRRWTPERITDLQQAYQGRFGLMMTTRHPDGRPGETRVKGANITWGARAAVTEIRGRGLRDSQVVVSALDCDTQVSRWYFRALSYTYLTDPNRDVNGYQPILLFNNNVWEVSAVARLVGYIASMWTLIDSTMPKRTQLFSSHALGLTALVAVNYWATDVVPDDSRQHWRLYFGSHGRSRTVPLHVPVYLDAVQSETRWSTIVAQYRQIRRWAYGVVDFPFLVEQSVAHPEIPLSARLIRTWRQVRQYHLWAVVPLLLLVCRPGLTWLRPSVIDPDALTGVATEAAALSGVVAPIGLLLSVVVALILMAPRPRHRSRLAYLGIAAEWLLLPVVVPLFYCVPAIDAQLRLLSRRYLGFRVTAKFRVPPSAEALNFGHGRPSPTCSAAPPAPACPDRTDG